MGIGGKCFLNDTLVTKLDNHVANKTMVIEMHGSILSKYI